MIDNLFEASLVLAVPATGLIAVVVYLVVFRPKRAAKLREIELEGLADAQRVEEELLPEKLATASRRAELTAQAEERAARLLEENSTPSGDGAYQRTMIAAITALLQARDARNAAINTHVENRKRVVAAEKNRDAWDSSPVESAVEPQIDDLHVALEDFGAISRVVAELDPSTPAYPNIKASEFFALTGLGYAINRVFIGGGLNVIAQSLSFEGDIRNRNVYFGWKEKLWELSKSCESGDIKTVLVNVKINGVDVLRYTTGNTTGVSVFVVGDWIFDLVELFVLQDIL